MANHGPSYGLDAELEAKRAAKYDVGLEKEARQFIQAVSGIAVAGDFVAELKDGYTLCQVMNKLKPGSCKASRSKAPFVMMENINSYLSATQSYGLATHDMFMTVDLYEGKNVNAVINNLLALRRIAESKGFRASGGGGGGGGSPSTAARSSPASSGGAAASSGAKFCSNGGTKAAGGKFCGSCGKPL